MKKYLVFVVWGYDEELPNGDVSKLLSFELIDKDYASALKRAKLLYPKKNYLLKSVIEKFKP